MNKLYYGDNLEILRRDIDRETIDLCYIDPPFNSKRNYNQIYNNIGKEDKAQAQAFTDTWEWDAISEDGYNQIISNHNHAFTKQSIDLIYGLEKVLRKGSLLSYLVHMTLRIVEINRVLKPTGSFYLHCDPTSSHYLKLLIDSIFLPKGGEFQNEIIWSYQRWTGTTKHFQSMHDIIFFYTKEKDGYIFNLQYEPYSDKSKHKAKRFSTAVHGKVISQEYTDDISRQKAMRDVWEISYLNSQAKERLGYPTQKPESLLERIIKASSNEGDMVLDAYCGCGTTVSVAERLKRKWTGIDITYQSISVILKRLEETFGKTILENIQLNGIPKDLESAIALAHKKDDITRKEFEKWAVLTYSNNKALINEKKGADNGIDGVAYIMEGTEIFNEVLFSVKSGHSSLSHLRDFCHVVKRDNAAMGIFITLEEPTKPMNAEASKMGKYVNPMTEQEYEKLSIITTQQILNGERLNIPTSINILKKAEITKNKNQIKLDF